MEEMGIRLNKYLSDSGVCSRREADRLIAAGKVTVDGKTAEMGQRIFTGQQVVFCGKPVTDKPEPVLLMVNKPRGIVCTAEKREKDNIVDFLKYPQRIYPVGRLDKESHGLILMTNQGELVNQILKGSNYHEKEYIVRVDRPVDAEFIRHMSEGVYLPDLDRTTRRCKVRKLDRNSFSIVLTQGWNRQIRRMCEACGYRVRDLERIRIMNLRLGDLPEGKYRPLDDAEYRKLMDMLKDRSNFKKI